MYFKSVFSGDSLSFDWLEQIEFSCPYLDIIIRNPKLTLIKEERVVNVEKSKRVTVESIKDFLTPTSKGCEIEIVTSRQVRNYEGKLETVKEVFTIVAFGKTSDLCFSYCKEGREIRVVGRIVQEKWTDITGKQQSRMVVVAGHVDFKPMV